MGLISVPFDVLTEKGASVDTTNFDVIVLTFPPLSVVFVVELSTPLVFVIAKTHKTSAIVNIVVISNNPLEMSLSYGHDLSENIDFRGSQAVMTSTLGAKKAKKHHNDSNLPLLLLLFF